MPEVFGVNIETPQEAQARIVRERLQRQALSRKGQDPHNVIGQNIGEGIGLLVNQIAGTKPQAVRDAEANQEVAAEAIRAEQQALSEGTDPFEARIAAAQKARDAFVEAGNTSAALQVSKTIRQMRIDKQKADLTRNKLQAETELAEARTESIRNPQPSTTLGKLQVERDNLQKAFDVLEDPSTPAAKNIARKIKETNERILKETSIVGRTESDVATTDPTKKTLNQLQQDFVDTAEDLDNIRNILSTFDAQDFTLGGRIEFARLTTLDFLDNDALSSDEKKELTRRANNLQAIYTEVNQGINRLTGAAVGVQEEKRLRKQLIDPNDGPTVISAKIQEAERLAQALQQRRQAAITARDITILNQSLDDFIPRSDAPSPDGLSDDEVFDEANEILSR